MRRVALLVAVAALFAACRDDEPTIIGGPPSPTEASPTAGPTETATPAELPGASCKSVNAGNAANFPDFVRVDVESEDGVDRISFLFDPDPEAPAEPPLHFVNYVDDLLTEGEGAPVEVEGEAFLVVSFQAIGVDFAGDEFEEVYTGPKRFTPRFGTLREAVHLGDFEGQVSWGLGLSRRACFVVEARPERLTLEFASS